MSLPNPPPPSILPGHHRSPTLIQLFAYRWGYPPSLLVVWPEATQLWSLQTAAAKSLQSCPTLCDPIDGSPLGPCPWDSPGKNTGVGCHFLLQCMKVKVKSLSRVRLFETPWTAAYQAPRSYRLYGRVNHNL